MRIFETWVLTYLLNAFWQVPLVFLTAWTAAWIAARATRRSDPATEHRIWALALALEALLPACSLNPTASLRAMAAAFAAKPALHGATVTVTMGDVQARNGLHMPPLLLHSISLIYAAVLLYFATRLIVSLYRTAQLRKSAKILTLSDGAQASLARMAKVFGLADVTAASISEASGPLVMGVVHPLLLLPSAILQDGDCVLPREDFEAALAHKFAHLQRHDFAKNLLYELLSLPVAFHPLRWQTRTCVAESRELICDTLAADAVHGRQRYARSLLRLASNFTERTRSASLHAIGALRCQHFQEL